MDTESTESTVIVSTFELLLVLFPQDIIETAAMKRPRNKSFLIFFDFKLVYKLHNHYPLKV